VKSAKDGKGLSPVRRSGEQVRALEDSKARMVAVIAFMHRRELLRFGRDRTIAIPLEEEGSQP
jgi:hypothetical protein